MVRNIATTKRESAISQALRSATNKIEGGAEKELVKSIHLKTKLASSKEDLQKVFKLAYEVYSEKGYAVHHDTKMEVSPYDAHHDTLILMVENEDNEVVGSLTLYYDDGELLPADHIFHPELNAIRQQGIKFAEVSRFVVSHEYQHQKEILISLINTIYIHAFRMMNIDELIIEVNPRHVDYYRKLLGFVQWGDVKECPRVNNAPAVLLRCNSDKYKKVIDKGESERRNLYNNFIPKNEESEIINMLQTNKPISKADQLYFNIY